MGSLTLTLKLTAMVENFPKLQIEFIIQLYTSIEEGLDTSHSLETRAK